MCTREIAIKKIRDFLESENKFLLITGTNQFEKHKLMLMIIFCFYSNTKTLFRVNGMKNATDFLSPIFDSKIKNIKTGKPINVKDNNKLYVDSMNSKSWSSTPNNFDSGVIYPIDSLDPDKGARCVEDLLNRNTNKIILISWTDNKEFSWTQHYEPFHVIYDAAEENPEQNKKVKQNIKRTSKEHRISNLPNYAETIDNKYLVKINCDNCRCARWAKLNKPYPGQIALRNNSSEEYVATCLKCGWEAFDSYNWGR